MTASELTEKELADMERIRPLLDDPMWRLSNLYKIVTKGDDEDDEGLVVTFKPNAAQKRLIARLHNRNVILKARQLGFTTLTCMLWLDTALFSKDPMRCGIVAQDKDAAEAIFRGKVRFAYERLPDWLREEMPLRKATSTELEFGHNGSSIKVATSVRSGTIHRLLVSEYGKISAKYPDKAREVASGSIPAVPKSGIAVVESTAEGQDGRFYKMVQQALALQQQGSKLGQKDWRLHFYAWWMAPEYTLDEDMELSQADIEYFHQVEGKIGRVLTEGQKAWYIQTRRNDFGDDAPLMWQEYPSFLEEAFQLSTEGCYYATQLANARKQGRVLENMPIESAPVNTFWDIGRGDMTCIWFHQKIGMEHRFIDYYEASGEDLSHYVQHMQKLGYVWGRHYLPHEADHKRIGETPDTNRSIKEMLENLMPGQRFEIVPRITTLTAGIQATRNAFGSAYFNEARCHQGLQRLAGYRKKWDKTRGRWGDEHEHDDNSHGADAFRQWGQSVDSGVVSPTGFAASRPAAGGSWRRKGGSPMAV